MRANFSLLHRLLPSASLLVTLVAMSGSASAADAPSVSCPKTLFLQTVTVRVFETSDVAESMLRSACIQASQRALIAWRTAAQASTQPQMRACASEMGAQGCLMGQAFTQPRCADIMCPLTQKCTISLVRLDPGAPHA